MLLNADLGESWYDHRVGNDDGLMPYLDLCNVACGLHGGDALTLQHTIPLAQRHGVRIGAHPSFPDRKHFGRRQMDLPDDRLYALLLYQVSALAGMVSALADASLYHVKPHGALYHYANRHRPAAESLVRVALELNITYVMGPPRGALRSAAEVAGLGYLAEGFVDRRYEPSLELRSRQLPAACIEDVEAAARQAYELAAHQRVLDTTGSYQTLRVDTLCLHGDHPGAAERARRVRERLADLIPPQ